jgi:hypothetical protein
LCSLFLHGSRSGFDSEYEAKSKSLAVFNYFFLLGDITIGAKTVVHPKAKIIAESGPIIIGGCPTVHIFSYDITPITYLCTGASLYSPYSLLLISNKFWMGRGEEGGESEELALISKAIVLID